jgi:hypothetical protein
MADRAYIDPEVVKHAFDQVAVKMGEMADAMRGTSINVGVLNERLRMQEQTIAAEFAADEDGTYAPPPPPTVTRRT